jgi:DNA gyrase subunit A
MEEKTLNDRESVPLEELVKEEYRTYQIYTLMDRAIPYLQDGLKPGQRRILYTLWKNQSKGLQKVSSVTGLVLTLHPHGPASVESAIVNLAQDYTFANNYPLVDKKGYFGERLEPVPAASRYIECKLGEVAKFLLFDDMEQVQMAPNYDEKVLEPLSLLPKLPLMLLNGAEGIGTGFSSVIPSFHHKDIIASMIKMIKTGKTKPLRPFVNHYENKIEVEKGKLIFRMKFEQVEGKFFITEIPRNFDAVKLYKHLNKFVEEGFLKDYIDSSVDNDINVELIFKKGQEYSLKEIEEKMAVHSSLTPNYTLISERGVKILSRPEEIIEIFTQQRLKVVQRRYEILSEKLEEKIKRNNEIVKFIRNKEYEMATKQKNRRSFIEYLEKKKYHFNEYLADMPIYRMTKEEVAHRKLMIKEDKASLQEYGKVVRSKALVEKKLIEELEEIQGLLDDWLKKKKKERAELYKKLSSKKRRKKIK